MMDLEYGQTLPFLRVLNFRTESMQSHWSVGILSAHCHEFSIWLKTCWNLMFGIYTHANLGSLKHVSVLFSDTSLFFHCSVWLMDCAHNMFRYSWSVQRGLFRSLIWGQDLADYHRFNLVPLNKRLQFLVLKTIFVNSPGKEEWWSDGKLPLLLIRWVNHNCVPCHDGHDIMGSSYCCAQAALSQQSGE